MSVFGAGAIAVAKLIIVNASNFGDRVLFLSLFAGANILTALIQFGWMISNGIPQGVDASLYSPIPSLLIITGSYLVMLGLIQRGRSSIQAVTIFLVLVWLMETQGGSRNSLAIGAGLFGGAALIWMVNFIQQSQLRLSPPAKS